MKRIAWMLTVIVGALAALAVNVRAQQSLGDAARAARQEKKRPAKKVFTNEDLPTQATLSVVGPAPAESAPEEENAEGEDKQASEKQAADQKKPQKPLDDKKEPGDSKENSAKLPEKIADDDKKISALEKEVDLMQREYKMRVAAYYADAGLQLRDPKAWAEEDSRYQAELAEKQKQLNEAKGERENLQEDARKAGEPASPE